MCTLSWIRTPGGYELFFNRDEAIVREPELPPTSELSSDVRYLAPTDGTVGGTWIAVNEFGLSTCLLNGYTKSLGEPREDSESRGHLVRKLAGQRSLEDSRRNLHTLDLGLYAPFVLFVMDSEQELLAEWDGRELRTPTSHDRMPLVSSGFDQPGAQRERPRVLEELLRETGELTPALLARFHSSHLPNRSAYSPCMHRDDAETRSFVHIELDPMEVRLNYTGAAPCTDRSALRYVLPLRSSVSSAGSGQPC